jgi:lipoprotein
MKKALPIILLIFGGILACGIGLILGGLLLAAALVLGTEVLRTVILPAVILSLVIGGHVVGAVFLQRLYQRRWRIGKAIFWICAGLPSVLIGSFSIILFFILKAHGHFSGSFGGLFELFASLYMFVYSGAFFVVLGSVLLIIHVVSHIKNRKLPEKT